MSPTPAILFITVGTGDLQPIFEINGTRYRGFLRDGVRAFHQSLYEGTREYLLKTEFHSFPERKVKYKDDWFCIEDRNQPAEDIKIEALHVKECKLILTPPKLAPVVKTLKENNQPILAVVIINTHRTQETSDKRDSLKKEPYACGKILSQWLASEFELDWNNYPNDIGFKKSGWVNILDGDLPLSGKGKHHPIHRIAVNRIDDAVKTLSNHPSQKNAKVILSTGGGIPEVNNVLKSCVQFRFDSNYETLFKTEDDTLELIRAEDESFPVMESFRLRGQASKLIQVGDITGAYASAKHLRDHKEEGEWVKIVEEIKNLITGLPFDHCNIPVLKAIHECNLRCLITGLRVESALWNQNWLEAINGTVTFYDQSLRDAMQRFLNPKPKSINDLHQTLQFENDLPPDHPLLEAIDGKVCLKLDTFRYAPRHSYRYFTGGKLDTKWISVLNVPSLEAYSEHLKEKTKDRITLVQIRNQLTHGTIDRDIIENAIIGFQQTGLWNNQSEVWGYRFLNQPLVQKILDQFHLQNACLVYSNIVQSCLNIMEQHTFVAD